MKTLSHLLVFGFAISNILFATRVASAEEPEAARTKKAEKIFEDLKLPSLKGVRIELDPRKLAESHSFTEEQFEDYFQNPPSFDEIKKSPSKFEKQFPIRVVQIRALMKMQEFGEELPDTIRAPIDENLKNRITRKWQREITTMQSLFAEFEEQFIDLDKKRDREKSKGWLAQWDYVRAQNKLRLISCYEYNLAMGKVKLEQLPELEELLPLDEKAKHNGWRLAATEKIMSPKEIRNMAADARNQLEQIVKDHPNTPWAVLAERQKEVKVGLKWEPARLK